MLENSPLFSFFLSTSEWLCWSQLQGLKVIVMRFSSISPSIQILWTVLVKSWVLNPLSTLAVCSGRFRASCANFNKFGKVSEWNLTIQESWKLSSWVLLLCNIIQLSWKTLDPLRFKIRKALTRSCDSWENLNLFSQLVNRHISALDCLSYLIFRICNIMSTGTHVPLPRIVLLQRFIKFLCFLTTALLHFY